MVRLFLNIGCTGFGPRISWGPLPTKRVLGRATGAIDILDTYSFVDIPNRNC
ncbi:MAG: hypothetical protein R2839_13060 [Thermomicrobiales bacterium]